MGKLINLTPHPIVVVGEEGERIIPPSGMVLRLPERVEPAGEVEGIPVVRKALDGASALPAMEEGVFYVVSLAVAQAARRPDFLVPDDFIRDGEGRIVGCRRLAVLT